MSFRGKLWTLALSGVVAVYAVVGGMPFVGGLLATAQQPVNDATAQLRIVESVLQHIQNDYVDDPNMEKVRVGALRGLAGGLDPYSSFLTADQVKAYEANLKSNKVGIGAELSQVSGYAYVISVVKGSNAEKAGLQAGDYLEYIDNKATRDVSLYDAKLLVSGDAGSTVTLRVLRPGERPQTIKVVRGGYSIPKTESRVESIPRTEGRAESRVGVVKVHSLDAGQANDVRSQVTALTKQGIQKIVLDLRGVAGGSLQEGAHVANLFIRDGDLAKVVGKDNKVITNYAAEAGKAIFDGQLAVLIDVGTAGAAEAVASAVLERKRGEVVGERSFGAGTEQKLFTLKAGDGMLLTVAKWASGTGTPFLGDERANTGVKPSVEVKRPDTPEPLEVENMLDPEQNPQPQASPTPKPAPKVVEDVQLKKALELLADKTSAARAG
jgi:carboxyl-terminal processing protease